MAFSYSSKDIRLDGTTLRASCRDKFGGYRDSGLDLDEILGNVDGVFIWGLKLFSKSAANLRVEGGTLHGELRSKDNSWKSASFDLNTQVANVNGTLTATNLPAALAVPNGQAFDAAVAQFGNALDKNPGFKISVVEEKDGSTLWYVNASAENKTDTFFKTYDANATASFMHVVQSKGRPIERVSADVFSARVGAEVSYIGTPPNAVATYAGVNANLSLFKTEASVFDLNLGLGVETGVGVKNGSLDVHVAGCGVTIGKRVSIAVLGNEFGIDFGKFFD
ncbi:MAG: hypothetical protein Q9165_003496 [Trypethelium subeluteriae]